MSLPPLLLERLKRRKIIKDEPTESSGQQASAESRYLNDAELTCSKIDEREHEEEEIIAEDYSDDDQCENKTNHEPEAEHVTKDVDDENQIDKTTSDQSEHDDCNELAVKPEESVLGCPNKYNIYHECSQYCIDNFSNPEETNPSLEQRKQLALLLRTHPIPNEWTVVYDPGVKTFYFWNIITNLVSWLPPGMNGFVSHPADHIRKAIKEMEQSQDNDNMAQT